MSKGSYKNFFANFANETRFRIIMTLKNGALSVTEITEALNEEQSKISHNLKILSDCHILNVKKQGRKRIYSLNECTIAPMLKLVEKHVKSCCTESCPMKKEVTQNEVCIS